MSPVSTAFDGLSEMADGLRNWRLAHMLGLAEIRRRYARSRLGQLWMTIMTGVLVMMLAVVWSALWRTSVTELLPFLAISLILWTCVSGTVGEATTVFPATGPIFLNQSMSFSTAIYGLIYRHLLILLHNLPIILIVLIATRSEVGPVTLLVLPGLLLLTLSLFWMSWLVALVCVRFRDVTQVVHSALLVAFFLTPVLWKPGQISPDMSYIVTVNPLAALLAVVRDPLLGMAPPAMAWEVAAAFAAGGFLATLPIIGLTRRRIIYWI